MNFPAFARVVPFVALALAYAHPVNAEPTGTALRQAEVLFKDALEAVKRDDWQSACKKFSQSAELQPRASSLVKVGICNRRAGHNVAAWHALNRARGLNAPSSPTYRPLLEEEIQGELRKIPVLDVSVTANISGLALSLDGAAMDPTLLGTALPVEFGEHQIVATAPGYKRSSVTVRVEHERAYDIALTMALEPASISTHSHRAAAKAAPSSVPDSRSSLHATTPRPSDRRALGIAIGGLGAAGLAVGGALALATLNRVGDSNGYCPYPDGSCDAEGVVLRERASGLQTAGIAVSVGGGLALATGIYLILLPERRTSDEAARPRASVAISGTRMAARWHW